MQVKAKVRVFVGNTLRQEGDVFEYSGDPDPNLEPLNTSAEAEEADVSEMDRPRRGRPRKNPASESTMS